jgi:hypothetical protein
MDSYTACLSVIRWLSKYQSYLNNNTTLAISFFCLTEDDKRKKVMMGVATMRERENDVGDSAKIDDSFDPLDTLLVPTYLPPL